jgi:hypothetical protein
MVNVNGPRTTSSSSRGICIYEQRHDTKLEAKLHFFSISSFL